MQINKQHNSLLSKRNALVACCLILLAAGFFIYEIFNVNSNKRLTEHADKTSAVQKDQASFTGPSGSRLPQKSTSEANSAHTENSDSQTPTPSIPEKPEITRAEQNGDVIKIVALLQSSSSGYCSLNLTKADSSSIMRTSDIVIGPSYYLCSFSIPRSDFASTGEWTVRVSHHIGSSHTAAENMTIGIE